MSYKNLDTMIGTTSPQLPKYVTRVITFVETKLIPLLEMGKIEAYRWTKGAFEHFKKPIFKSFLNTQMKACGHNPTRQKRYWTTKKNIQNWINIYVLPFKAMAIMENYCFFFHMNIEEFKPKIHWWNFKFKLWFMTSKMNTYV